MFNNEKGHVIVNIVNAEGPFLGATIAQDLQSQYYNYCIFTIQLKNIKGINIPYNII